MEAYLRCEGFLGSCWVDGSRASASWSCEQSTCTGDPPALGAERRTEAPAGQTPSRPARRRTRPGGDRAGNPPTTRLMAWSHHDRAEAACHGGDLKSAQHSRSHCVLAYASRGLDSEHAQRLRVDCLGDP
jgi:hypothetical protein